MMNVEHAENLLREYLLHHPPRPFQTFVGVGMDPKKTGYLVFREPGTLCDLVIAVKFVPERRGNCQLLTPNNRKMEDTTAGAHWEHAMFSGMSWRKQMNHKKNQNREEHDKGVVSERIAVPLTRDQEYESPVKHDAPSLPPSLIIAATFTNQYGLELVGHVDEFSMEDAQFRLKTISPPSPISMSPMMPTSNSVKLQYTTILGDVQIYRWKTSSNESPCNLIGFIASSDDTGVIPNGINIVPTAQARLSLRSLSTIVERNNIIRSGSCRLNVPVVTTPLGYVSRPRYSPFRLAPEFTPCLLGRPLQLTSPKTSTRMSVSAMEFIPMKQRSGNNNVRPHTQMLFDNTILPGISPPKLPFAPSSIAMPNPLGPFAPPYQYWEIQWEAGPLDTKPCRSPSALFSLSKHRRAVKTPPGFRKCSLLSATDRSKLRERSSRDEFSGFASHNLGIGMLPIPNRLFPMQALLSGPRLALDEQNTLTPAAVSRQTSCAAPPYYQQNAVLRSKMLTGTMPSDEGIVEKDNVVKFLFDENREKSKDKSERKDACIRDNPTSDPVDSRLEKTGPWISKKIKRKKQFYQERGGENASIEENDGADTTHDPANLEHYSKTNSVESRSDGSTFRSELDCSKKGPLPSNGDIAINLLCPFQHPPSQAFEISHETPEQRDLRLEIVGSSCCKHLTGRFVVEFLPQHPEVVGQQQAVATSRHGKWTIRKCENDWTKR